MTMLLPIFLAIWSSSIRIDDHQNLDINEPVNEIILFTSDAGDTWQNADAGLPDNVIPMSFYASKSEMYLGSGTGLYTSPSALPQRWHISSLDQHSITGIFPSDHGYYVTTQWNGFYEFVEDAGLWKPMHLALPDKEIHTLWETHKGTLLVSCTSGLYVSADHGNTWQKASMKGLVTKITESDGILIACTGQGIWRSADEGHHWQQVMWSPGYTFFVQAIQDRFIAISQGQEFAGIHAPNELYHSTDQGKTWHPMFTKFPAGLTGINDFHQVGEFWFACSTSGIYRSADMGTTWKQIRNAPKGKSGFYTLKPSGDKLFVLRLEGC
jgi:photosystem II stability/assembly factor-like uncharacterized protein